jgi:single-strand DNA-binding protein
MAGSVNKVILIGNLGRDPEVRTTQDGAKVVNVTVATSESWNDKQSGERKERTEWHRVVIWNQRIGEFVERYLAKGKGKKVYVEGALETRKWTDQQGVEHYTTEVVLRQYRGEFTILSGRSDDAEDVAGQGEPAQAAPAAAAPPKAQPRPAAGRRQPQMADAGPASRDLDDEIPF